MNPIYKKANPDSLKNHLMNIEIYGDKPNDEILESISKVGIQAPIIITSNNVIISGHTRNQCARKLGLKEVPVIVRGDLVDELDIREAIIEANRQREKTNEIKAREFKHLKQIEEERAKKRQKASKGRGKKGKENFPDLLETGQSRDKAAEKVGMSGKTAEAAAEVVEVIDELESEGETAKANEIRETLNKSVSGAHKKATGEKAKPKPFNEKHGDDCYGRLIRFVDDRGTEKGKGKDHSKCIGLLKQYYNAMDAWRAKGVK